MKEILLAMFFVCAGMIVILELIQLFTKEKDDVTSLLGWTSAIIWALNSI